MNPFSPEQIIAKKLVQHALARCRLEKDNTEFLIQVKETLIGISRRGIEAINDEMFNASLVLANEEIIIPSQRGIFEHELLHHVDSLN